MISLRVRVALMAFVCTLSLGVKAQGRVEFQNHHLGVGHLQIANNKAINAERRRILESERKRKIAIMRQRQAEQRKRQEELRKTQARERKIVRSQIGRSGNGFAGPTSMHQELRRVSKPAIQPIATNLGRALEETSDAEASASQIRLNSKHVTKNLPVSKIAADRNVKKEGGRGGFSEIEWRQRRDNLKTIATFLLVFMGFTTLIFALCIKKRRDMVRMCFRIGRWSYYPGLVYAVIAIFHEFFTPGTCGLLVLVALFFQLILVIYACVAVFSTPGGLVFRIVSALMMIQVSVITTLLMTYSLLLIFVVLVAVSFGGLLVKREVVRSTKIGECPFCHSDLYDPWDRPSKCLCCGARLRYEDDEIIAER